MKIPNKPANEHERLRTLKELLILDTGIEEAYEEITKLAAEICDVPICLISLVDEDRQWFKSKRGLSIDSTPRDYAFCAHAILEEDLMEVQDAREDKRFFDNPLVTGDGKVIYYAGAQLKTPTNHNLGTLCIIDQKPRKLTDLQRNALKTLSHQVSTLFELRRTMNSLVRSRIAATTLATAVSFGHEINNPLAVAMLALEKLKRKQYAPEMNQINESLVKIKDNVNRITSVLQSSDITFEEYCGDAKMLKLD